MPELVAIGSVGAFITFLLANFNLYIVHRSFSDPKFKILNINLNRLGWYWSMDQGTPAQLENRDPQVLGEADYQKATRSAFIFGTLMIFLSWLGLLVLSVYMISVYKIAKSRIEKNVMNSDLVKKDIQNLDEIKQLLSKTAGVN